MSSISTKRKRDFMNSIIVADEYWIRVESFVKRYNDKYHLTPQSKRRLTNSMVINGLLFSYARDNDKDDIFFIPQRIRVKQYEIYPSLTFRNHGIYLNRQATPILKELKRRVNITKEWEDNRHKIKYGDIIIYLIDHYLTYLEELIFSLPRSTHHLYF